MVPGSCPKVVRNCRIAAFAVKIYSRMGPTNSTAWKNNVGTLPLQLQHWRLGKLPWLQKQTKLPLHNGWRRTRER